MFTLIQVTNLAIVFCTIIKQTQHEIKWKPASMNDMFTTAKFFHLVFN